MQFGQIQVVECDFGGWSNGMNMEEVSRSLNDAPHWNGKSRIHTLDGLGTLEGRNMVTVLRVSKRHPEQGSVTRTRKNGEPIERRKG